MNPHVYLHIPFCQRRCTYCDFISWADQHDLIDAYVDALCAELALHAQTGWAYHDQPTTLAPISPLVAESLRPTLFFGGGTPSLLSLAQIERILEAASALVPLVDAEISFEANPGTLLGGALPPRDYLQGLRALGITRLSLGVQSLDDAMLRLLGRIHTAHDAQTCVAHAHHADFPVLSLDAMYGLPGQSLEQWQHTLATLVEWQPDHLSLYQLTLDDDAPLAHHLRHTHHTLPDDDTIATMYEYALEWLSSAGYTNYEVSNWARANPHSLDIPPAACHHNLAYWLNLDYLGAGAAAHSHCFPHRWVNHAALSPYLADLRALRLPLAQLIPLAPNDLAAETMLMGLRLSTGVSHRHFAQRCGQPLLATYPHQIAQLCAQGLLAQTDDGFAATHHGRMLLNQVVASFLGG